MKARELVAAAEDAGVEPLCVRRASFGYNTVEALTFSRAAKHDLCLDRFRGRQQDEPVVVLACLPCSFLDAIREYRDQWAFPSLWWRWH